MSVIPGHHPGQTVASGLVYAPASYIFNGTDELMQAAQGSNAADRTRCTISLWMKTNAAPGDSQSSAMVGHEAGFFDVTSFAYSDNGRELVTDCFQSFVVVGGSTSAPGVVDNDNTWDHYHMVWDSNEVSSADRLRMWKNGSLITPASYSAPGSSALFHLFTTGTLTVGNPLTLGTKVAKRLAFIDVLDGIALNPTNFAFDNGGTWTRQRYAGSYGPFGFKLDGTNGFIDVANNRTFTATNMTAVDNLSTADLPPYTN